MVIVTEASRGQMLTYGNGQLNFEIAFEGKAVHSSRPEDGRNAIHDAAMFIRLVEAEHQALAAHPYPGLGPGTFSVGVIRGGLGGTIVADHCELTLDRRVLPNETLDGAEAAVVNLLRRLEDERPGLRWSMKRTLDFPPILGERTQTLPAAIGDAVEALGAPRPQREGMRAATDAAWYDQAGAEVVVFGPGDGSTAHRPDESVSVADVLFGARALALTCAKVLAA
jgi:acetylornithine deacetylase